MCWQSISWRRRKNEIPRYSVLNTNTCLWYNEATIDINVMGIGISGWPVTEFERSEARTVLGLSNTYFAGSNVFWVVDSYKCFFCVLCCPCFGMTSILVVVPNIIIKINLWFFQVSKALTQEDCRRKAILLWLTGSEAAKHSHMNQNSFWSYGHWLFTGTVFRYAT